VRSTRIGPVSAVSVEIVAMAVGPSGASSVDGSAAGAGSGSAGTGSVWGASGRAGAAAASFSTVREKRWPSRQGISTDRAIPDL
jgi:hypothetical protein